MSELLNKKSGYNFRRNLLANASTFALLSYLCVHSPALATATDDDSPTLWIELGGQADRIENPTQTFAPPFVGKSPQADRAPMVDAQRPPPFSVGGEGKVLFEPHDSNWVFSAAVRYGRADSARHLHKQTAPPYVHLYYGTQVFPQPPFQQFGDGQTELKESHFVLDFQAGKDVGLGLFGTSGKSVISAGVRFAQFVSKSNSLLHARPEYKFGAFHSGKKVFHSYYGAPTGTFGYRTVDIYRHTYTASIQSRRTTHAIGPSVSWDASLPVAGNGSDMTFNFDWGVNAAVLFGRQKAQVTHATVGHYYSLFGDKFKYPYRTRHTGSYFRGQYQHTRSRTVVVPNVGGMLGVSLRFSDIHFSAGYRADFFLNAMDNGIDVRKSTTVGFYGPFAAISVGFGG